MPAGVMIMRIDERAANARGTNPEDVGRVEIAEMQRILGRDREPFEGDAENAWVGLFDADERAVDDEIEVIADAELAEQRLELAFGVRDDRDLRAARAGAVERAAEVVGHLAV